MFQESYPSTTTTAPARSAPTRSGKMRAALAYIARGLPVFPCEAGGKAPLTRRGYLEATTDHSRVHAWWNANPGANIGLPTGERSGLLILDVDNFTSLDALTEEHGELPETTKVKTGGGGMHLYFRYPADEIRNSTGKLGPGLDVRGEGGYVIVPGSATEGAYEWIERRPLAEPPEWLLEAMRETSGASDGYMSTRPPIPITTAGPPIPEGQRDTTLTRVAGRLHDGTRDLEALARDLMAVNEARCEPPVPEVQVRKIARSIHRREPCKSTPEASPEALEVLERVATSVEAAAWRGMGGKTARSVMVVAVKIGRRRGELIPAGVRIPACGVREIAKAAGVGIGSAHRAINRLREAGWMRRDDGERSAEEAGALVLVAPRKAEHIPTKATHLQVRSGKGVPPCAPPWSAPRFRWSAPRFDRIGSEIVRSTVRRLGKSCEHVVDALESAGGSLSPDDLAAAVGVKRVRDLLRRQVARLEAAGVVELVGDRVCLCSDWLEAIDREREISGEIEAARLQADRYEREKNGHRDELRRWREERRSRSLTAFSKGAEAAPGRPPEAEPARELPPGADGFVEDLERLEASPEPERVSKLSPLAVALAGYLERSPRDALQPPSWLGITLWAYGLFDGKPDRTEVSAALDELGGDRYRREIVGRVAA